MSDNAIRCPQCGHENSAGDHFCSNCGTRLPRSQSVPDEPKSDAAAANEDDTTEQSEPIFSSDLPRSGTSDGSGSNSGSAYGFPPPVTPSFMSGDSGSSGNQPPPPSGFPPPISANLGESDPNWRMSSLGPPPKPKRRVWLWIVLGILGFCILVCIGLAIFFNTGAGQDWLNDVGTTVAKEATKQAGSTPTP